MAKIGEEIKKTLDSLMGSIKNENNEEVMSREEERKMTQERENSHKRLIEKAQVQGARKQGAESVKTVDSVTQANRPARAITINESATVKVMEPKMKDDVFLVIGELKSRQPVLIKLGSVESNIKKSILDSLYGACHYAGYSIEQVDSQIILIDPSHKPAIR